MTFPKMLPPNSIFLFSISVHGSPPPVDKVLFDLSFTPCVQQVVPSLLFLAQQSIMSGGIEALQLKEEDVLKLLAAGVHLGASNVDFQMESYVYKRKADGENATLYLMF